MKKRISWMSVMVLVIALLPVASVGADGPTGVSPSEVETVIFPGNSVEIGKTVHTPPIPPDPIIIFLADTTASMGDALNNVKTNATQIMNLVQAAQPTAEFGVAEYRDTGDTPVYLLNQPATPDIATAQAAINSWAPGGGGDCPEAQLHALTQLAGLTYPPGSTPIIVWFGDADGHDPSHGGETLVSTSAALQSSGVTVLAVDAGNPVGGCSPGLDHTGQATSIADATGGLFLSAPDANEVAATILAGLSNLPVDVSIVSDCAYPITTSFDPAVREDVASGDDALFAETISVAADAPGGVYECDDHVLIDGAPLLVPVYTVTQGSVSWEVEALYGTMTIEDFYQYGTPDAASANTPTDLETAETSLLFLYDGPAGLSLVFIHDRPGNADGGQASVALTGIPVTADWVVRDDPSEGPNWNWIACCTDGGAIRGGLVASLTGGTDIVVDPTFVAGITDWEFLSGPSTGAPDRFALDMLEPVTISAELVPVVEHKTIRVPEGFLTGGGQIGRGSAGMNFGGNVGYLNDYWNDPPVYPTVGQWQFNDRDGLKMHSTSIEFVQFWNDATEGPEPPDANANAAYFGGGARVKVENGPWNENCVFFAEAHDHGEPSNKKGVDSDRFGIMIECDGDTDGLDVTSWDYDYAVEDLDNGNIQIHSGIKDG